MEQFLNNRKYLLIFILFIVLLMMIIISFILKSNQTSQPETNAQPTIANLQPTTYNLQPTTNNPQPTTQPTTAPAAPFTGARDISFSPQETDQINEERNLRRNSPIKTQTFTITYNPADDIFEVTLVAPKESSQNDFEVWRKTNIPNVSLQRFTFK